MFSYRHAFHAGNHGDVLKHAILLQVLDYYGRKDKPFQFIDTHAGAGAYSLSGAWARQSGEAADGLQRLLKAANPPTLVQRYLQALRQDNPASEVRHYPGSPRLALRALRAHDRMDLFEWHPNEIDVLRRNLQTDATGRRAVGIHGEDGFTGLQRLLPPPARRGVILIDPSYEDKHDYRRVLAALNAGRKRFAQGCFMVWHPLIARTQAHEMSRALQRQPGPWLHARLFVRKPPANGRGLFGSGLFLVNPPYTLENELRAALPWMARALAQDGHARFQLDTSNQHLTHHP